jgi:cellulose synthase/poly-beta-1,6-N-acetylglucosamine synthase-like glycosyltransferase
MIDPELWLATLRLTASPRFNPPPTPLRSTLIHGGVILLWLVLFARSFQAGGVLAWSVGLVYIAYDTVLLGFVFVQTRALLRPAPSAPVQTRPSLGVIVTAHNEEATLPATVAALLASTDPPDRILVADDGSTDGTVAVMAACYGLVPAPLGVVSEAGPLHPSVRLLRVAHGGKARTLNVAATLLDTEILLTVDADTLAEPAALGAMRDAFAREPELVCATGVLTPVCGRSISGRFFQWFQTYEYVRNFLSRYAWMQVDGLLLISGAFAGYRRDALLAVGGFDPDCLVEDYELTHRLRREAVRLGVVWRTRVIGGAHVRTDAPGSIGAFMRQRRRWFGGFLQTQLWYREMVGNPRYGRLGTWMLPVKAIDTLQPIYGLTGVALLLVYLARGEFAVVNPVAGVIGAKIAIDLAFYLWSLHLYRRWLGDSSRVRLRWAIAAALVEPFSFQILRHAGAALGWVSFLTGERSWGVQQRVGLLSDPARATTGRSA